MSWFARTCYTRRALQARIFLLTYLAYAIYTATRQAFSITKSTLHPKANDGSGGVPPFDGPQGSMYLGILDSIFLSAYSAGLFVSGPLGDRCNLRWFLGFGMIFSGVFCGLFAMAGPWKIENYAWFVFCNIGAGLAQSTGWPATVTLMTRWFGSGKRGLLFGLWASQSSVGNIIGKVVAANSLNSFGWEGAFFVPALICIGVGVIQLLFIIPHPRDLAGQMVAEPLLIADGDIQQSSKDSHNRNVTLAAPAPAPAPAPVTLENEGSHSETHDVHDESHFEDISFLRALLIPGVIPYSISLFFSKLVAYAFIFWLPFYLSQIGYSDSDAGNWSVIYDVGGIVGGIIAGVASDRSGKRGVVTFVMLILCVPVLFMYSSLASYGVALNAILMFVVGVMINGPYTLMSSAIAADLGQHPSLLGNPKAMSSVTGIVDGCGSIGSAVQGVLISYLSDQLGWNAAFYFLMCASLLAAAPITRIGIKEWKTKTTPHTDHNTPHTPNLKQSKAEAEAEAEADFHSNAEHSPSTSTSTDSSSSGETEQLLHRSLTPNGSTTINDVPLQRTSSTRR